MNGSLHFGIALGAHEITAVAQAGGTRHVATVPHTPPQAAEDRVAALQSAFEALGNRLAVQLGKPVSGAHVSIALLPPLSDARLVPLPPLRPREAEAVLRRDAARHFLGGSGLRVVAAEPPSAVGKPAFAAAASAALVETVFSATVAAGWKPVAIVPGGAAWRAIATGRSGTRVILAVEEDAVHALRFESATLVGTRRAPVELVDEVVAAAGDPPGSVSVFAPRETREPLVRALSAAGWTVAEDTAEYSSAGEAAAANAAKAKLELVPPMLAVQRRERSRGMAVRIAAAAAILAAAAAGVQFWGLSRELNTLTERRAAIRNAVAPLLTARDSVGELNQRILRIRNLDDGTARLTRALFDLSMLLPMDTHLTSLQANGDTLIIEASGARAGAAIQALRSSGSLAEVHLLGTVDRELEDGSTSIERFRLMARLVAPVTETSAAGGLPTTLARRSP